jgi:hypothetical protein
MVVRIRDSRANRTRLADASECRHGARVATRDADGDQGPVGWWVRGLVLLGVASAAIAMACSAFVFPYLSSNSDEGAYLVQAETIAHGSLFTRSPGVATSSFLPWLAVPRGGRFLFKFTPVYAGWLAGSDFLFGSARPGLAAIAAADVILLTLLVRALGGSRRAALGAGALLALSPAWIIQAGTYLPYLFSLALLLGAAVCVAHGVRSLRSGWFVGAGAIWGVAFVGRQYDAALLLLPLALVVVAGGRHHRDEHWKRGGFAAAAFLAGAIPFLAMLGLYDHAATGSVLRLPFNLITSEDGVGLGRHRVQPHDPFINYTLKTAIHASLLNGRDLLKGVAGSVLLLAIAAYGAVRDRKLPGRRFFVALAGCWVAGYMLFWGTYAVTVLSDINSFLGPIYYVPAIAAAVAVGALTLDRLADRRPRLVVGVVAAIVAISAIATLPLLRDDLHRTRLRSQAVRELDGRLTARHPSLLLVSPVRGPFVGHPFPWLRNRADFGGGRLVSTEDPSTDFALVGRHRDRHPYFVSLINVSPVPTAQAVVEPIDPVRVRSLRLRCSGPPPAPGRRRIIVVRLDGAGPQSVRTGATYVDLQVTSAKGTITVVVPASHATSSATRMHTSMLSVTFRDIDARGVIHQSVRRIPLRAVDGQIEALLPGLQAQNGLGAPLAVIADGRIPARRLAIHPLGGP